MKDNKVINKAGLGLTLTVIAIALGIGLLNSGTKAETSPLTSSLLCMAPIALTIAVFASLVLFGMYYVIRWGNASLKMRDAEVERRKAEAEAERIKAALLHSRASDFTMLPTGQAVPKIVDGVVVNPNLATSVATHASRDTAVSPVDDPPGLRGVATLAQGRGGQEGAMLQRMVELAQKPMEERLPHTVRVMNEEEAKQLPD